MSDVDDLVAWLRARLDNDDRLIGEYERYMADAAAKAGSYEIVIPPGWGDGEPFNIERMRAEVEVKRRLLDWLADCETKALDGNWWNLEVIDAVKALAQPHAGRAGWREEWRM